MGTFKAAAIQMRSGESPQRNAQDMERLVREAAGQGATYIQTPEMTGAMVRDKDARATAFTSEDKDIIVSTSRRLASELGIFLHIGSTAIVRADGKLANRALLFGLDGAILATYDKIHMINGTKLGFAVCYDLRFPQLFRAEALAGAQVLTVPAAFTRQTGEAHWHVLLRARAIENGAYVIAAAQGGLHEDGRETYGHSLIVDPWGRILAEVAHDAPGVIVAEIDPAQSLAARKKIPNLKNARDFTVDAGSAYQPLLRGAAS